MFSKGPVLALVLLVRSSSGYRQPYEYLEALDVFGAAFSNPAGVFNGSTPSPLSSDVVGRIDVITTFVGQDLNAEFLFGLFYQDTLLDTTTQLIGIPSGMTIQSAVVEPPVVAVSYISDMAFPTVNLSIPLQIDMFMAFDDDSMKVVSYDAILRRIDELMAYTAPYLAPQIAEELNSTSTNVTELIQLKTAADVCAVSSLYCTGEFQQYDSQDACLTFMEALPFGESWQGGMNTGWCRYIHKNLVQFRPDVHCPHIGPTGGDMCRDRNYLEVTSTVPFNQTLLSYNSSYNAADMKGISENGVQQLVKVQTQAITMTTVAFYPVPTVLYTLVLYMMAKFTEFILSRFSVQYDEMSFENKRNTVTYVLDTFVTFAVLILQLVASPILASKFTFDNVNMLKAGTLLISGLYIFELTYRPSMRWPLLIHHFCTIFAIVLLLSVLAYTGHPQIVAAGEIWLFQATTEQSVFIGLFMYRLRFPLRWTRDMLRFGAVQSFIFKLAFAAYLLAFWAQKLAQFHTSSKDIALSVMLVTIIVLLMCTQIYGAWAVWCLSEKVNKSMQFLRQRQRADSNVTVNAVSPADEKGKSVDEEEV
ncbi:secreted protein [Lentinula edodes]|uniref:Secreted protein n=1 Tax=Lentinula edodes TaxID=5353 RepID=A0A1Q3EM39_LENED|nr:uncharacterized protein C8R40DRAFT_802589 [Lentinula edodes]KAH7868886.1 hypothetical protein C8R40DRAFT_802589 [Lentinula edodes]GAW08269.1 secreted protein [Lentinula edodes]